MSNTPKNKPLDIPDELREEAAETIKQAFQLFSTHNKQLAEGLAAFQEKQSEIKVRVKRGANRTTGRIV